MTCLLLFYEFFKTGLFAVGGGLATLPFLYDMAARHPEWFTVSQLADMLAVSESTPGPLGVNMATYVGYLTAGIPGAVAATMGLVAPSVIVILIVAAFLKRFRESRLVNNVFYGLRPASAAMVAAAGLSVVGLALLYSGQTGLAAVNWKAVALAAVLEGLTSGIALLNPDVYDQLRFWQAGSLDIRNLHTLKVVLIPVLIAGATALLLSRALNSLSLGSDTATALGSRVARTQLIGLLAITVLCGSATAVVGPIAFIGLMMPHMARWLVGADHRWSLPVTLLATPALLLFADIIGRVIVPGELRVSVVSAFIGAPVLIFLVRRKTRGGA